MPNTEPVHSTWLDLDKTRLFAHRIVEDANRRSAQRGTAARLSTFERLHSILENINRVSSAEQRLKVLLHAALQAIPPAQRGAIYLSTASSHTFVVGAVFPDEPHLAGSEINAYGGYVDAAAQVQCPVLIADAQQEDLAAHPGEGDRTWPVLSALIAPFVIGGRTVGVLALENCTQTHAFTQEHLNFASLLSDYAAMTVDNARLSAAQPAHIPLQHPELNTFYELAERVPVGLLLTDQHRHYVWANYTFYEMTEFSREELERDPPKASHLLPKDLSALAQETGGGLQDLYLPRRDGTHRPVKARFLSLDALGIQHVEGYIGIFQDQDERASLERQLFHMQRLSNIGTLVSSIAHELNNPLTAVIGFSELVLTREDIPPECREDLEAIARQAQQGLYIVRDLLNYVRLQSETLAYVDINCLIRQLIHLRTRALKTTDLDLRLDLADSLPPLLGNAHQLQQVMFNLIDNAEQACTSGDKRGHLCVRTRPVDGERYIRISVRDNGPGIPSEVQPHVFKPFFTTKRPGEGIGLGLSISRQIVERHGGRIWLESAPDKGTTVLIDLPTLPVPEKEQSDVSATSTRQKDPSAAHILVVDDEKSIGHMLMKALTRQAHHVDVARDGDEALRRLQETAYDVVFLDLKLPGLPGRAIYAWLKQNRSELAKRTVVLTGDTLNDETIDFLEQEHIPYLLKPFQLTELRNVVKQVWTE